MPLGIFNMPGINDQQPTTINPGLLSASNLVNSNAPATLDSGAIQAMTNAMRTGALTAQDVIDRTGELGKTKRKAEIELHKRQIADLQDPNLIAARHAVELAAGKQATLSGAQAEAAGPLVQPQADLAQRQMVAQQNQLDTAEQLAKYPSAAIFDKIAPGFGLETPMTVDGKVDWAKKAKIGAQIALHDAEKTEAQESLKNITTHLSADGTILTAVTKQGQPVSPEEVHALQKKANQPFQLLTPGAASVVPASLAPIPPEPTGAQRAQLVNQFGIDAGTASTMSAADVQARLAPAAPALPVVAVPTTPGVGDVIPGVGISLGQKATTASERKLTEVQTRALSALEGYATSDDIQGDLKRAGYNPASFGSFINGMLPEAIKSENRKLYETAMKAWTKGILRLESGAAISVPEQKNYERIYFPQVGDSDAVQNQKALLRKGIENSTSEIVQSGGVVSPEAKARTKQLEDNRIAADAAKLASPAGAAKPAGAVITLNSGQKVQRGADGQYYPAQ